VSFSLASGIAATAFGQDGESAAQAAGGDGLSGKKFVFTVPEGFAEAVGTRLDIIALPEKNRLRTVRRP